MDRMAAGIDVCFFGHSHIPSVFTLEADGIRVEAIRNARVKLRLEPGKKYLVNPGSVGQPRDRNPKASYALYDAVAATVHFDRVPYRRRGHAAEDPSRGSAARSRRPARHRTLKGPVLGAAVALPRRVREPGGPGQAPPAGDGDRLGIYARLLSAEDSRSPDADLFARAASSRDPWIRAKTGARLRAREGPGREPDPRGAPPRRRSGRAARRGVRSGPDGRPKLVPLLAPALDDRTE